MSPVQINPFLITAYKPQRTTIQHSSKILKQKVLNNNNISI